MQVVGVATQQFVYVASRDRKFNINEILLVEDPVYGDLKGEVIETQSFNRYIPLATERNSLLEPRVLDGLRQVGFRIEDEEINIAKVRLLEELTAPVKTGANVRVPEFYEIEKLLVSRPPEEGLVLGVIRGTAEVASGMPEKLKGIAPLYDREHGMLPQDGVPFILDHWAMADYPHIGIFGGSGSGKSFGMRVILEELMRHEVPTIVFDPHFEMDFAEPLEGIDPSFREDFSGRYVIVTAGKDAGVAFEELNSNQLAGLLRASGGVLTEAMENAIYALHRQGDTYVTFYNKVYDLIEAMEKERALEEAFRSQEIDPREKERVGALLELKQEFASKVGNVAPLKGIAWRLDRIGREKVFNYGIDRVVDAIKQQKLVVIRGSSLWVLQIFASYLVKKMYDQRREFRDAQQRGEHKEFFPPFVVATDEAHNFAPKNQEAPAKSVFREVAQEGRKYGVFLILASQRPALLDDTITAQLNTKIVFRTTRSYDIATMKEETDMTEDETARLPYLPSGVAFVSSAMVGRTVPVRIRASKTQSPHRENPFAELRKKAEDRDARFFRAVKDMLPIVTTRMDLVEIEKRLGRPVTEDEARDTLSRLARLGKLREEKILLGYRYSLPGRDA
ncbi:MAG TPA: DUF87 domain-containing protein [Firmicutes bacterium]|nr:DUF87 domain-containing protein [Bacillota bacterium]